MYELDDLHLNSGNSRRHKMDSSPPSRLFSATSDAAEPRTPKSISEVSNNNVIKVHLASSLNKHVDAEPPRLRGLTAKDLID